MRENNALICLTGTYVGAAAALPFRCLMICSELWAAAPNDRLIGRCKKSTEGGGKRKKPKGVGHYAKTRRSCQEYSKLRVLYSLLGLTGR